MVMAVTTGIALSIVCVGALFRFMSLPGSGEMLMMGSIGLIIVSVLAIVLKSIDRKFVLIRTIPGAIIGIALLFVPQLSIVKLLYRDHPAYVEAYVRYYEDPGNEELYREMRLEFDRMKMTEEEFKESEKENTY